MPNYSNLDLRGKRPYNTHQYLLLQSASIVTDGYGDSMPSNVALLITASNTVSASYSLSASYEIIFEESSSHANTADTSSWAATSSYPWFQTGSNTAYIGGNVGIGTANPGASLDIAGTGTSIRITDTDLAGLYHQINADSNTGLDIFADTGNVAANSYVRFGIDNSEKVRINSEGKVGIGTTVPTNSLDVAGNISCSIITASLFYGTASWAESASIAASASWAPSATPGTTLYTASIYDITSSHAVSSSWAPLTLTSSLADTSSWAITASWAEKSSATQLFTSSTYIITASWAESASVAISSSWSPSAAAGTTLETSSLYDITSSWATTSSYADRSTTSSIADRMVNFTNTGTAEDAIIYASSGSLEVIRVDGSSGFVQLNTIRLHHSSSNAAIALMGASGKAGGAFIELAGNDSTGTGGITANGGGIITVHHSGSFQVRTAPAGSSTSVMKFEVVALSGDSRFSNNLAVTGSIVSLQTGSYLTGSLLGTASWAESSSVSISSSWAPSSIDGTTLETASLYDITASWAQSSSQVISASWSTTSSFTLNTGGSGTTLETASLYNITSSWALSAQTASWSISSSYLSGSELIVSSYKIGGNYSNYQFGNYTLTDGDNGKLIIITSSADNQVRISSSIASGFNCSVFQSGSGRITFIAESGVNIRNRSSHTGSAGQYAMVGLLRADSTTFILAGDTNN